MAKVAVTANKTTSAVYKFVEENGVDVRFIGVVVGFIVTGWVEILGTAVAVCVLSLGLK